VEPARIPALDDNDWNALTMTLYAAEAGGYLSAAIAGRTSELHPALQMTSKVLGDDWYAADDGDAARGVYLVLLRDGGRRVILSWGTHRGSILGAVSGSALTRLEFADDGGRAAQRLVVNVIIDNGVAAGLTRTILPLFAWFVDRKLAEGFRTTAAAAAWAHTKPDEFCAWLGGALAADRRSELLDVFDECTNRSQ
jgi:hypothetical protein